MFATVSVAVLICLAYICKCYAVPWYGVLPCLLLPLVLFCSGGGVDHCVISFEGGSCTKVEQADMRSVRYGEGGFV